MIEPSKGNTRGTLHPPGVCTQQRRIAVRDRPRRSASADPRDRSSLLQRSPARIYLMRSRMREIRTSGSVRGEGGNPLAYSTRWAGTGARGAHATNALRRQYKRANQNATRQKSESAESILGIRSETRVAAHFGDFCRGRQTNPIWEGSRVKTGGRRLGRQLYKQSQLGPRQEILLFQRAFQAVRGPPGSA